MTLAELIAACEAALEKGTQGSFMVTATRHRTDQECPELEDGEGYYHCTLHKAANAEHDARTLAALLNAAPGMLAAAKRLITGDEYDSAPTDRMIGYDIMAEAVITPLYDALVVAGAIVEAQDA